jgi:hypothetical protein
MAGKNTVIDTGYIQDENIIPETDVNAGPSTHIRTIKLLMRTYADPLTIVDGSSSGQIE